MCFFIGNLLKRSHVKQAAKLENLLKLSTTQNRLSKSKELVYKGNSYFIYFFYRSRFVVIIDSFYFKYLVLGELEFR